MELITNFLEFYRFVDILPELERDQVYFISLSARNKYLSDEERKEMGLGRTEMFARTIVRSKDGFEHAVKKMQNELTFRTTKTGKQIPEKCIVVYVNINPSSMLDAYLMLKKETDHELAEITKAFMNNKQPNFDGIRLLDRKLMNCIQKTKGNRYFLDIDFDIPKTSFNNLVLPVINILEQAYINCYCISTKSGFHLLINHEDLRTRAKNMNTPLHKLVQNANDRIGDKGEVIFNKNQMIPMPGTVQAGYNVRFV